MKPAPAILFAGLLLASVHAEVVTLAHPGEPLPANKTVVWSPLFQASWDKLNASSPAKLVWVDPPNRLMSALDGFRWQPNEVMPEGSWKTWCGEATPSFVAQVNKEAAAITKEAEGLFQLLKENPKSKAFFGILNREVEFQRAFFRSRKAPMLFRSATGEHPVKFFGVRDDLSGEFGDSVRVLAWRPVDRSHAIQIRCKQSDDRVILYLPSKPQDFATACLWLRKWRADSKADADTIGKWNDGRLHASDEIQIPYVSLESKVDFTSQLGGFRYYGAKRIAWSISRAEQLTRFRLHEKGASVRVETSGQADPFGGPFVEPRRFLYNRPFFVFIWRDKAEWPWFGAWIGDDSVMDHADF